MARKAGQGKEEEESRARQQEEKTLDRHEDKMEVTEATEHMAQIEDQRWAEVGKGQASNGYQPYMAYQDVVDYIDRFFYVELSLHLWVEAFSTMMDDIFDGFLDLVCFHIMILMPLAHVILLLYFQLDFTFNWCSPWCLSVDLCICFHQLLDEGSMMTVMVFTNLITGVMDINKVPSCSKTTDPDMASCSNLGMDITMNPGGSMALGY
ncbi:hypothetical protein STEG23_004723 [Scotinomys teguina]